MAKSFQNVALQYPCISHPPNVEEQNLVLTDDLKLELFNTFLFNLRGEINSTLDDLVIH
jgi:hypothetical protein